MHITSDLHVTGDLFTRNYHIQELETLKVNVSNCDGKHLLTPLGLLSGELYPLSSYSPGVFVNGDLYYMDFRSLTRFNPSEMRFMNASVELPFISSPEESRTSLAMFSPRNQDGILYIAAGNDFEETMHYYSTWAFDVRQVQWTQKATHDFCSTLPQSECSLDRCFVYGGLTSISRSELVLNTFYEYDYQKDVWKNVTDSDTAYVYGSGLDYLPHMDVLVSYGGIGRPSGSSPGTRAVVDQVSLFHLSNSSWVHYWDPPHLGDVIPVAYQYAPLLPLSAVYNDAIFIATAKLPAPSRLLKLSFNDPVPTYHHIIFENAELFPGFSRGQIGGLIGDHILVVGGGNSATVEGTLEPASGAGMISLC